MKSSNNFAWYMQNVSLRAAIGLAADRRILQICSRMVRTDLASSHAED